MCTNFRNVNIPRISLTSNNNKIVADFGRNTVRAGFCGDSNYLLSVLLQNILENNRTICLRELHRKTRLEESQRRKTDVAAQIAETLADNMFTWKQAAAKKPSVQSSSPSFDKLELINLELLVDFYRGSDVQRTRILEEGFTIKLTSVHMVYETYKEALFIEAAKIQTTVGYIDETVRMRMTNEGGFWDVNVSIPSVYIRTRQAIVDTLVVLFTFNTMWNEYDILYNTADTIKFRNFIVDDIHVRFKYYNSPIDYRKVFKGNWKHLIKLVPHCDLSITFPSIILRYQVGWEDVVDAYLKELLTTQRLRCVRKVVVGTAKRKLKKLLR